MATPTTNIKFVMQRRTYLGGALGAALSLWQGMTSAQSESNLVSVWKTASCGCCKAWIAHLQPNGFKVVASDVPNTAPIRKDLNMPAALGSCHTAKVENYVIEGHVPAKDIQRLLKERPRAIGLTVPGMPAGSPGMEMGTKKDKFNVLFVLENGTTRVYQSYS
jgi:hypothetical protein